MTRVCIAYQVISAGCARSSGRNFIGALARLAGPMFKNITLDVRADRALKVRRKM